MVGAVLRMLDRALLVTPASCGATAVSACSGIGALHVVWWYMVVYEEEALGAACRKGTNRVAVTEDLFRIISTQWRPAPAAKLVLGGKPGPGDDDDEIIVMPSGEAATQGSAGKVRRTVAVPCSLLPQPV